jgi:selenium metabolism protein YedF
MREIDCRGLACPAPVISTKKALEESGGASVQILLDNGAARENVLRFCRSKGCTVVEKSGETGISLVITCEQQTRLTDDLPAKLAAPVILIASDSLGNSQDELGRLLLKNFIMTLLELQKKPEKIIFINRGVLLTAEGSELLEPLGKLVNTGVEILSCGVCLEYFGLGDKLVAGAVTNMYTIAESMLSCGNVIRL